MFVRSLYVFCMLLGNIAGVTHVQKNKQSPPARAGSSYPHARRAYQPLQPPVPTGEGVPAFRQHRLFPGRDHLVQCHRARCNHRQRGCQQSTLRGVTLTHRRSTAPAEAAGNRWPLPWLIAPRGCFGGRVR